MFTELKENLYQSFRIVDEDERTLSAFDMRYVQAIEDCEAYNKGTLLVFDNGYHMYIVAKYEDVLKEWIKNRADG